MLLADSQRWMQALISDEDGTGSATGLVNGTPALPAHERVGLYRRAYRVRLVGCLREAYPALRHALTPELFDDFALDYLAAQPPHSYTLNALGAGWAEHLEATRPGFGGLPEQREAWPDFLVDLAGLERTFCEVYDAPGAEGAEQPSPADFSPDATVEAAPCLRLLRARFPVGAYMLGVRAGGDPPLPAPAETVLAVCRRDYVVTITELDGARGALLGELARGASLTEAAAGADLDLDAARMLAGDWTGRGFFSAIRRRKVRP